jgi:hypothetical protein
MGKVNMGHKKMRANVSSPIIAGIFVIAAALLTGFGPGIWRYIENRPDVQIQDVVTVQKGKSVGVDIVLRNKSASPQAITSFGVEWSQGRGQNNPPFVFAIREPRKIYFLQPTIEIVSREEIAVHGNAESAEDERSVKGINYALSGSFSIWGANDWHLGFGCPIRAELAAGDHLFLTLFFPEQISISHVQTAAEIPLLDRYVSMNSTELNLRQFLKETGPINLTFNIDYDDSRRARFSKSLNF